MASAAENKALVTRLYRDLFTANDLAVADEIFAPDYFNHEEGWPEPIRGPQGFQRIVTTFKSAFPDLTFYIEDQLTDGDKVVTRWLGTGTNTASLMGMPVTGRSIRVTGISIERIAGGKIVETWVNRDTLGMLQQLGVIPAPEAAGAPA